MPSYYCYKCKESHKLPYICIHGYTEKVEANDSDSEIKEDMRLREAHIDYRERYGDRKDI